MIEKIVCVVATLIYLLQATTAGPLPDSLTNTTNGYMGEEASNIMREEGSALPDNATTTTMEETAEEEGEGEERRSCPGYYTGPKDRENCEKGTGAGVIDHMEAFGMTSVDWSSCGLPSLPQAK